MKERDRERERKREREKERKREREKERKREREKGRKREREREIIKSTYYDLTFPTSLFSHDRFNNKIDHRFKLLPFPRYLL